MRAETISVGTEILLGEILDTNSQYIASRLPALGIDLYFMSTAGDNLDRLSETLERALRRSDLVVMTGGLGPTEDDLTREAIAGVLGEELRLDPDAEARLRAFFAGRGVSFPERNLKQAMVIPSAQAIPNPRGTAPGWWVEKDGRIIVAMPGPPHEMSRMWESEVEPRLSRLGAGRILVTRTLKTVGMGESHVDQMMAPLLSSANPTVGIYARQDGVHVRIAAKAASAEAARALIRPVEEQAREILGASVWGADSDRLEGVIGRMLNERGLTLATMESCTGGLLASTITDVAGSSDYFKGGYVAYSAQMKVGLGVDAELIERHGVISSEVACDMARVAREQALADYAIGVTGIVGEDEVEGKPPGTVHIAVHDGRAATPMSFTLYHGREATKRRAVATALVLLRRVLLARA